MAKNANTLHYTNIHGVPFVQVLQLKPGEGAKLMERIIALQEQGRILGGGVGITPILTYDQAVDALEREARDPMPQPS